MQVPKVTPLTSAPWGWRASERNFLDRSCVFSYDRDMRAYLKSRTELWWAGVALPALIVAHWAVVTLGPLLFRVAVPESVRMLLHLL